MVLVELEVMEMLTVQWAVVAVADTLVEAVALRQVVIKELAVVAVAAVHTQTLLQ